VDVTGKNLEEILYMKKNRSVEWLVLILFIFAAGIYYYGLHRSFWPDPESIYMTLRFFYRDKFGYQYAYGGITDFFAFISYKLFGAGYRGARVYYSFVYMFILGFTTLLAIWNSKENKINWHLLPMLAFVVVLLNPGDSEFCGYHTDAYHVYPYDMHTESILMILITTFIVDCILYAKINNKIKVLLIVALLAVIALNRSDLMFLMGFVAPVVCILVAELFKRNRETFIESILVLFALIVLLRVVGIFYEPIAQYFESEKLSTPYGKIYGNAGFVEYDDLWANISVTLTEIMALFNI
jgi:hypothetical protein